MLDITALTAIIAVLGLIILSVVVSLGRLKTGVLTGQGDDPGLLRRIRAQGNFVEFVPLGLIVLGLAEMRGAPAGWLWTIAGLLVFGRLLHAVSMLTDRVILRPPAQIATYLSLLGGAAALLGT